MSPEDLQRFNQQFQAPDEEELTSGEIDPAPAGYASWKPWAAERWPTSID